MGKKVTYAIRLLIPSMLLAGMPNAGEVELKPATTQAFDKYVQAGSPGSTGR